MAQLTDTLQDPNTAGLGTIQPVAPAPSVLQTFSDMTSGLLGAQRNANEVQKQQDAQARAKVKFGQEQVEFQQKQQDRAAGNAAAAAVPNIYYGVQTVPSDTGFDDHDDGTGAAQAAAGAVPTIAGHQEAASQGAITPAMAEVRTEATIRGLLRQFPNSAATIMSTLKDQGVTNVMTREYDRAAKAVDAQDAAKQSADKAISDWALKLGIDYQNLPPDKQAAAKGVVLQDMASQAMLDRNLQTATIQEKQSNVTTAQQAIIDKQNSRDTGEAIRSKFGALLFPVQQAMSQILADPSISDADKDKQTSQTLAIVNQQADLVKQNLLTRYGGQLNAADLALVNQQFDAYKNSLTSMLTGPTPVVEQNHRNLQIMQDKLGIKVQDAMPLWAQMGKVIGPNALGALMQSSVLSDPSIVNALRKEMSGFSSLTPDQGKVHLQNILSIIQGNTGMHSYTPQEARAAAPHLLSVAYNMTNNPDVRTGKDGQGHDQALNAIGGVANVAATAVPQWGVGSLSDTTAVMTKENIVQTLMTGKQDPRVTNAYIPGLTRLYTALSRAPTGDQYYQKQWDSSSGTWKIAPTKAYTDAISGAGHISGLRYGGDPSRQAARDAAAAGPSSALQKQVAALNRSVDVLSRFGAAGSDSSLPTKGVTDRDRRAYYGQGIVPQAVRDAQQTAEGGKGGKSNTQSLSDIVSQSLKDIGNLDFTPADSVSKASGSNVSRNGRTDGWTPRVAENSDASVDNKVALVAKSVGKNPDDPLTKDEFTRLDMTALEGKPAAQNNLGNMRDSDGNFKSFPSIGAYHQAQVAWLQRRWDRGARTVRDAVEGRKG